MKTFYNLSNHKMSKEQEVEAKLGCWGCDVVENHRFPNIDVTATSWFVDEFAADMVDELASKFDSNDVVFHVMGEMTFTHAFVKHALERSFTCVASVTERIAVDNADGTKTSKFEFAGFRAYR